ncbi:hypothetical protein BLA60_17395 [Actinophytocola xinjiangensis]|uniref:Uncharacterized protein n=2 Tax=Actinophytocola xinjiangensis TaxID=485602 RepID=A0A7Z0WML1_9PSEU|nr:hypothetical protein BLA60_17395 [Actinophytocola xinjiangensis]
MWREPSALDVSRWTTRRAEKLRMLPTRLVSVVVAATLLFVAEYLRDDDAFLAGALGALGAVVLVVGIVVCLSMVLLPSWQIRWAQQDASRRRQTQFVRFQVMEGRWHAQVRAHSENDRRRRESIQRWYPLRLRARASRVDVFGGTPDGWASLITTLGSSLLSGGSRILVLDFTEQQVAGGLAEFASLRRISVNEIDFPSTVGPSTLLAGLAGEEIVDLLADSVRGARQGGTATDHRSSTDLSLLRMVTELLGGAITFTRLVAGLRVLRRDPPEDGQLTADEVKALTKLIDSVGHGEQEKNELRFLIETLHLLAHEDAQAVRATVSESMRWPSKGLAVVTTTVRHSDRKELVERLIFHHLLHVMRTRTQDSGRDVVFVAGADHFGLRSLEAIARQARRVGVRLILLLEHLRGDVEHLMGTSDSATIVMRLGNAKEAAKASEFIGKDHKFVISQLTKQVGQTFTMGTSEGLGAQEGTSESRGTNTSTSRTQSENSGWHAGHGRSDAKGRSTSTTASRSRTWQSTGSRSAADSSSTGTTESRVYEFTIEPTEIQGLPATSYILVETGSGGRRVVAGDCNPGIVLLEQVATTPRQ